MPSSRAFGGTGEFVAARIVVVRSKIIPTWNVIGPNPLSVPPARSYPDGGIASPYSAVITVTFAA